MGKEKIGPPFKIIPGSIVKGTGNSKKGRGYLVCQTDPVHPRAITLKDHTCKYVYLHRVVLENKLGYLISDDEVSQIDHLDGDRTNNDPSNLVLKQLGSHQKEHVDRGNHFWEKSPMNKKRSSDTISDMAHRIVLAYLSK
jgi:hypothetical protein